MDAKDIVKELIDLKNRFIILENHLKAIQNECEHHFEGDSNYKKCTICMKVEALYYQSIRRFLSGVKMNDDISDSVFAKHLLTCFEKCGEAS